VEVVVEHGVGIAILANFGFDSLDELV